MSFWIAFKNKLPASDVSRVEQTGAALRSNVGSNIHASLAPVLSSAHDPVNATALAAGYRTTKRSLQRKSRLPRRSPVTTKSTFYRVNRKGDKLGSKRFVSDTPMQVAKEVLKNVLSKQMYKYPGRYRAIAAAATVTDAVASYVNKGWLTEAQAEGYLEKYEADKARVQDNKATVFIKHARTGRVRQYEGCYQMLVRPTYREVEQRVTKRVVVNYVKQ